MVNFTTVACRISSRLKRYNNYKNRLRLAKVILKNKLPRFFLVHCVYAYLVFTLLKHFGSEIHLLVCFYFVRESRWAAGGRGCNETPYSVSWVLCRNLCPHKICWSFTVVGPVCNWGWRARPGQYWDGLKGQEEPSGSGRPPSLK